MKGCSSSAHLKVRKMDYWCRCAEVSAVQAYQTWISLSGMEIGYVVKDAGKWEVDIERDVSEFDASYYRGLLEMAWEEVAFAINE